MPRSITFQAPRRITFVCGGVPKITAGYLLIDATPEPLPRGFIKAAAATIPVARCYLFEALRLKRLLTKHPSYRDAIHRAVKSGRTTVRQALADMLEIEKKMSRAECPQEPPKGKNLRRPVYQNVCQWPEPVSAERIRKLGEFCGVARSTILRALQLRRRLASDPALHKLWHGRAMVEEYQPGAILARIDGKVKREWVRRT